MTGLCFLVLWGIKCLLTTLLCHTRLTQRPPVIVRGASTPDIPKLTFLIKSKHSKSQETTDRILVLQTLWHSRTSHILLWTVLFLLKCYCWTFCTVSRNVKWGSSYGCSMVLPQKWKIHFPHDPVMPRWVYTPKELKIGFKDIFVDLCSLAALFTIAESWKQPRCPSMKEWINTMWSIHAVEYYSALNRKGILFFKYIF